MSTPWRRSLVYVSILAVVLVLGFYTITYSTNPGVTILSPSGGNFAYNASTNKLQISANATAEPAYLGSSIFWSMSPVGSVSASFQPSQGENTTATYSSYPQSNSDFGSKTLTARVTYNSINYYDNVTIKAFFPATDKVFYTHGVLSPNWFYYWNPVIGDANVYYKGYGSYTAEYPCIARYGEGAWMEDEIWVYDMAYSSNGEQKYGVGPWRTGIDFYANVVLHEAKHRADYKSFRQNQVIDNYPTEKWDFNQSPNNHNLGSIDLDEDNDDVPDSNEHPSTSPSWPQTSMHLVRTRYNLTDLEFRACYAETVSEDTYASIDWTQSGKQW